MRFDIDKCIKVLACVDVVLLVLFSTAILLLWGSGE